ncbi:MAG TPA: LysM peptidoglycan-binding domain-containing protein [Dehalococcoidia bacterium]|nr:LysM peptidoglycan-binding domain-containing protein [Dehalococcoidia bacterium]
MDEAIRFRRFSRRQVIGATAAAGIGSLFLRGHVRHAHAAQGDHHLVWVWQFSTDGEPNVVAARLRDNNLGIVLKTHDGVTWMSEYDTSPYAVSGPQQIQVLAKYFEDAGVPFHTWCVLQGSDPVKEAQMAAAAALSGARSVVLDIEPHSGFWQGSAADAKKFGDELRRLAPNANLVASIDPRPWMINLTPLTQFGTFVNQIWPQQYWRSFDTQPNYDKYAQNGFPVPQGGVTPEFLLDVSQKMLPAFGLPIVHVGQGDTSKTDEWTRFLKAAYAEGTDYVSVWRYGVTSDAVLGVLKNTPPQVPAPPPQVQAGGGSGGSGGSYTVQSGDTLGAIAAAYDTDVQTLMDANGLSDPNYLYVGQQLTVPGAGGGSSYTAVSSDSPPDTSGGGATASSETYTVQPGDTLYAIAGKFGTTVDAIASANNLSDPNFISEGQSLLIA